jgi:hypothetical protein
MFEHARPLINFIDDQNRKTIEATPPEELNKAMRRDGVEPGDSRGSLLLQLLQTIPPGRWAQESGWTVNELIDAAYRSEWKNLLIGGWKTAATRIRDAEWLDALLNKNDSRGWDTERVFKALPRARQESLAIEELKRRLSAPPTELQYYSYIYFCDWQWSETLSRLVIDLLLHQLALSWSKSFRLTFFREHISERLDPEALPEAIARISDATKPPARRAPEVKRFLNKLRARYEILNAF